MSRGRVLVIDDDEWVCRLLAVAMKESGFEITITENAAEGFYKAVEEQPDCIVCDVDLPDHNGYWVAKKIRAHPSRIANAPFVFLSGLDDREHRLEGFQVGGDAYLTKPFRIDEVVAQVDALIQMAARLNKARVSRASIPPPEVAMHGDLAQMSLGTLLTLLDLERRSGVLLLKSEAKSAEFNIVAGTIASTTLDGAPAPPLEATRKAMSWASGKFAFTPTDDRTAAEARRAPMALSGDEHGTSINALLMEAARLEDEERNAEGKPNSSSRSTAWKETLARHTPRPFAAVTGALPESSSIFTSRPPPSSGRGPPPPLDSIMAPPALSESEVETFEPPGVVAKPATTTDASALAPAAAPPAAQSPSPQGIQAAVPLPRFPVRPAAGVPASAPPPPPAPAAPTFGPAPSAPPPAPTFGPAPSAPPPAPTFGPAPSAPPPAAPSTPPPAPTFGPTPVAPIVAPAAAPPAATPPAPTGRFIPTVPSWMNPTPAVPPAPGSSPSAVSAPPSVPKAPASPPGAIPAPPLAARFQGGRTPTLSGSAPRPVPGGAPPSSGTPKPFPAVKLPAVPPMPPSPATHDAVTPRPSSVSGTGPAAPAKSPAASPTGTGPTPPNPKPPLPGPRTAFGSQLRSLSPARPMRAVTPPSPPAVPAPPSAPASDVDSGWSKPPSAPPPSSSGDGEPLSLDDLFEAEIPPSKGKNS